MFVVTLESNESTVQPVDDGALWLDCAPEEKDASFCDEFGVSLGVKPPVVVLSDGSKHP